MAEITFERVFLNEQKVMPSRFESSGSSDQCWYLDNGASNHMTGNLEIFAVMNKNVTGKVKFGDGSCVEIVGRGTIVLEGKTGEHRMLTDVYYIPHLKSNIFSLGQATEGGCEVRMKDDQLWLYERSG